MTRGRWAWVTAWVLAVVVAVGGVGYYVSHRNDDRPIAGVGVSLPKRADAAFPVTLSVVNGTRQVIQGAFLQIGIQANADSPVSRIELWDGARRYAVGGGPQTSFRWPALAVGPHLLYARAFADGGGSAASTTYATDVLVAPTRTADGVPPVAVPTIADEDGAETAARLGVPASSVDLHGPTAIVTPPPASDPLESPQIIVAPATPVTDSPDPASGAKDLTPTLEQDGCSVKVSAPGVTGAVRLVHAMPGRPGFVVDGEASDGAPITLKNLTPGTHVVAIEHDGRRSSPVSFLVPQRCAAALGWRGTVSLSGGMLTVPVPVGRGYAYISVGDEPYRRMPADPNEFFSSPSRRIDVTGMLPKTGSGRSVSLEVWEQNGRDAAQIGTGALKPPKGSTIRSLDDILGEPGELTLSALTAGQPRSEPIGLVSDDVVTFDWRSTSPRINSVRYQVLGVSLTPNNHDIDPLGTLTAGLSKSSPSVHINDAGHSGQFSIDTHDLARDSLTAVAPASPLPEYIKDVLNAYVVAVWVRVVGLEDTPGGGVTSAGVSSRTIEIVLPATVQPKPVKYALKSVTVDPGAAPNFGLAQCVIVSGTHWDTVKLSESTALSSVQNLYPKDGRYCYDQFNHKTGCSGVFCWVAKAFKAIVNGLSAVWDVIASAYNGVIDLAAGLIAKFNPLCLALRAGGSGGDTCEAIGKLVARSVISAVLSAYGLPPNLPTSAQLKSVASGNLAELGVGLLSQLGIPCDDLKLDPTESAAAAAAGKAAGVNVPKAADGSVDACRIAVEAVLAKVQGQIQQSAQDGTAASAGLVPCPADQCTMVPDPGAHTQPPIVTMVSTLVSGTPSKGFSFPVDVTIRGLTGKDAAHQGGRVAVRPWSLLPNTVTTVVAFPTTTPFFNVDAVDESEGVLVEAGDPNPYSKTKVLYDSRTAHAHYGPHTQR